MGEKIFKCELCSSTYDDDEAEMLNYECCEAELTDVEVEIDGKKKKMNKGKAGLEIKGILTRDPDSKWDTSAFYSFIRDIYNKYIIL